jgi:hypothetical protein
MKKQLFYIILFVSFFMTSCLVQGGYVVRERPAEVVYVRPAPPSAEHIWITGDWYWANGGYRWKEGHWERRREGHIWRDGHWQNNSRGYRWIPGHWD